MNIMSWNCRGLSTSSSPAIPYLFWLVTTYHPTFLFLQETKTTVSYVHKLLSSTALNSVCGVDAEGARGGLVVFCWGMYDVQVQVQTQNYIFCKISSASMNVTYVLFLYGDPVLHCRQGLWHELFSLLHPYQNYLIIGDINQVGNYEDKLGGSTFIGGWEDFMNWQHSLHLQDIGFQGPRYTWTNARSDEEVITERLDRAYATSSWLAQYLEAFLQNLPITQSDHAPILLHTTPNHGRPRRPYQVENWCLNQEQILPMIQEIWGLCIKGSPMYTISRRLTQLRFKLKTWCLDRKLFWGINWKTISASLSNLGASIQTSQQANTFVQTRNHLLTEAFLGHTYWQQRRKEHWIQLGELPTQFFFRRIKQRAQCNRFHVLKNSQGEWLDSAAEIEATILNHFKNLYTHAELPEMNNRGQLSENIDQVLRELHLSESAFASLQASFTAQDIKEAMEDIHGTKSPGSDGFSSAFFHRHWDTIGDSVVTAVNHFLTTGFLLKEWNSTILVLIPKQNPPEEVNHLRPISLCNTIYKCAAKCMVKRMKPLLPDLISGFQNAFIPGRHMEDNILISHELLHIINKQRGQQRHLAALKLDMNKAYDRVNWMFILKILTAYGFPPHWVRLVEQCISTVTYRVLINGSTSKSFTPSCGLRQGDPLSPYLFLFCMDILSRMTTAATDIKLLHGIQTRRGGPIISHLFFVDDALFFFKATDTSCNSLNGLIHRFRNISGQIVNLQKSFVKFSPNTPAENQLSYKTQLRMDSKANLG